MEIGIQTYLLVKEQALHLPEYHKKEPSFCWNIQQKSINLCKIIHYYRPTIAMQRLTNKILNSINDHHDTAM